MLDIDEAFATVAAAIKAHGAAPEEVVTGLETLRGSVGRWLAGASGALDAPDHGRWLITPSGKRIELSRRPTLRRLVTALIAGRVAAPGKALSASELIAAGWSDEPTDHEAAMNRLRVAICRLRQLGLENIILTTSSGWLIDPRTPLLREPESRTSVIDELEDEARNPPSGIFEASVAEPPQEPEEKVA